MKRNRKGANKAKEVLKDIGFEEITNIPFATLVGAFGATYMETEMDNADGKIIRGTSKTIIKINSCIRNPEKKRFTVAHELGHLLLHDRLELHKDTGSSLNWFQHTEKQAKRGIQEWEANDFAAELLMPENLFREVCADKSFSPQLLMELSVRFQTSITSVIFRYYQLDLHPVFIVYIHKGIVKYWLKSTDLIVYVSDYLKLPPPEDSVAQEYLENNYATLYTKEENTQEIYKSTWFTLPRDELDQPFYEYCIPMKKYETLLSVVWEV
jgi:Zn-dependent peptidase ImmA (M78 family)